MKSTNFNQDWQFSIGEVSLMASLRGEKKASTTVDLPHDAMVLEERRPDTGNGGHTGFYPGGTYTYTKNLTIPQQRKEAGFNRFRSSHNPLSRAMLNDCDRLGLLVMDETFDIRLKPKCQNDYANFFADWWERDVEAMVMKDIKRRCFAPRQRVYHSGANTCLLPWERFRFGRLDPFSSNGRRRSGAVLRLRGGGYGQNARANRPP